MCADPVIIPRDSGGVYPFNQVSLLTLSVGATMPSLLFSSRGTCVQEARSQPHRKLGGNIVGPFDPRATRNYEQSLSASQARPDTMRLFIMAFNIVTRVLKKENRMTMQLYSRVYLISKFQSNKLTVDVCTMGASLGVNIVLGLARTPKGCRGLAAP